MAMATSPRNSPDLQGRGHSPWPARVLRHTPNVLLLLLSLPVFAGIAGSVALAFNMTTQGADLEAFRVLAGQPGLWSMLRLSVTTGFATTALSLTLALLIPAALSGTRAFAALQNLLAPLLALPHAAAALGLGFLAAPSGWIARALSPWATGWNAPPDLLILNDPWGLSLSFGLIAKELPFLLLMTLAALSQTDATRRLTLAATFGYGRIAAFLICVAPPLYRRIRLPTLAVLTYAMTTVDMAAILGPDRPATLALNIARWMTDPSLSRQSLAAAAALLQLAAVMAALLVWRVGEVMAAKILSTTGFYGRRLTGLDALTPLIGLTAAVLTLALLAGIVALALWSVAGLWPFPATLPQTLTLANWATAAPALAQKSAETMTIALIATILSLTLTLASLQAEQVFALPPVPAIVLYLPLLVPQICFLPGVTILFVALRLHGTLVTVTLSHLIFVLPYVHLTLAAPFRAWDQRIAIVAAALGGSEQRIFWQLRLPMLTAPILSAAAVGLAVSIAQYLPTLLIGGGRVTTLTTEALALSSGGNRRLTAAYALMQALFPLLAFASAVTLPRLIFRNRRSMQFDQPMAAPPPPARSDRVVGRGYFRR